MLDTINGLPVHPLVVHAVVVTAVAVGVQVYRVGDSGAQAVWADQMTAAPVTSG